MVLLSAWLGCAGDPGTPTPPSPPPPAPTGETGGPPTGDTAPSCATPFYEDLDGDGLGTEARVVWACEAPEGFAAEAGDCDDGDRTLTGPVGPVRFVEVGQAAGLTEVQWNASSNPCLSEALGGGAAVGDVDGDGDLDLFLPRYYFADLLLLNRGDGTFEDAGADRGIDSYDASNGAVFFDADGDRDLDLYVTRIGASPNLLLINDGTGRFTEEAAARGAALDPGPTCALQFGTSAGDVDGDGDLDLLVAGWQDELSMESGVYLRSALLRNDGAGRFVDDTLPAGLGTLRDRAPLGLLLADRDRDGDPDLHLVSDWGRSGVFLNDGAGRFAETFDHGVFTDENGMGGDFADADGDGDLDWFVTSIWDPQPFCPPGWGCTGNRLYVDRGDGVLLDGTDAAGVREGQWGWGAAFWDLDLDGVLDLALTGGYPALGFWSEPGKMWRGRGDGTYADFGCRAGWIDRGQGRSLVPFDADRDGDLDLLVVGNGEVPRLWRAEGAEGNGWLEVSLDQPGGNRLGIGAIVRARATPTSPWQTRLLSANGLYLAGRPPEVHFGFGAHAGPIATVEVTWPDGAVDTWTDVGPGFVTLARP